MSTSIESEWSRERNELESTDEPVDHAASGHKWVIRTPDGDEMATRSRLASSWPLLRMYASRQFNLRYRQSSLGLAWTVVQPVAIVAIYGLVFFYLLGIKTEPRDGPYLSVLWIGITAWMYVMACVQAGTVSLLNDAWLIGRVWFPREIIPLAPVVAGLVDLAVAGAILVIVVAVQGASFSLALVSIPVVLAVLIVWAAALSLIFGAVTVFFRDMTTIVALGLRLLFISTPVMYAASVVPPEWRWLHAVNPFAVVINNLRAIILGEVWPNWELLALHGAIGATLFYAGLWYIRAVERRMVDIV